MWIENEYQLKIVPQDFVFFRTDLPTKYDLKFLAFFLKRYLERRLSWLRKIYVTKIEGDEKKFLIIIEWKRTSLKEFLNPFCRYLDYSSTIVIEFLESPYLTVYNRRINKPFDAFFHYLWTLPEDKTRELLRAIWDFIHMDELKRTLLILGDKDEISNKNTSN